MKSLLTIGLWALLVTASHALEVLTWNIHHAKGIDGVMDPKRLAKRIAEETPDVIFLQEVDHDTKRSQQVKQSEVIANSLAYHHCFIPAIPFQGGGYGQAILSKTPLINPRHVVLSTEGEARIAIIAETIIAKQTITLVGIHLDAGSATRRLSEINALLPHLAKITNPIILGGDWNQAPDKTLTAALADSGLKLAPITGEAWTFPANAPHEALDHFWLRGLSAEKSSVVPTGKLSDHLVVRLTVGLESK
jgi:endonuclease/exonuclease/phosphatase family metal-dependent hydrolase